MEIPFERVWKEDWLKKTCSKKKWQSDIRIELEAITKDYEMLDKMNVEDPELLKSIYLQSWERLQAIDEYNRQMDIRKKAEELREIKVEEKCAKEPQEDKAKYSAQDTPNEKTISNMVVITGKEQAWSKAKEYMQQLGLKVEEVI